MAEPKPGDGPSEQCRVPGASAAPPPAALPARHGPLVRAGAVLPAGELLLSDGMGDAVPWLPWREELQGCVCERRALACGCRWR